MASTFIFTNLCQNRYWSPVRVGIQPITRNFPFTYFYIQIKVFGIQLALASNLKPITFTKILCIKHVFRVKKYAEKIILEIQIYRYFCQNAPLISLKLNNSQITGFNDVNNICIKISLTIPLPHKTCLSIKKGIRTS